MIVISYGTKDGIYDRWLARLQKSCEACGLRHDLVAIPAMSRMEAYLRKPGFILDALERHAEPVIWLDADAVVTGPFALPGGEWDIGLVPSTWRYKRSRNPTGAFAVAARATDAARAFLAAWHYLCQKPDLARHGDHRRLTWTREMRAKTYREIDISRALHKAIIRDFGRRKQELVVVSPRQRIREWTFEFRSVWPWPAYY
jgi:hypothetical protein